MKYLKLFGAMILITVGLTIVKLNIVLGLIILFILVNIILNPPSLENWLSKSKHKHVIKMHLVNSIQFSANYIFLIGLIIVFQLTIENIKSKIDITLGIGLIILGILLKYKKKKILMIQKPSLSS